MKVVALRALGLGDFCTAVPALRALARAFPDDELCLAGPSSLAPLLPYVGTHLRIVDHRALDRPLPAELDHAALAVNLHDRGSQSTARLRDATPQVLVAYELDSPFGPALSWDDHEHERDRWCRLLTGHGIDADPAEFHLTRRADAPSTPYAVVHPGASAGARRWPPERWAKVVTHLVGLGLPVMLTGTDDDQQVTTAVRDAASSATPHVRDLTGRTPLGELAELVAHAAIVVSSDTGIAHLAFAFDVASVTLYGPVSPVLWGPPPGTAHVALWCGRHGDPHAATTDPGLLAIDAAQVVAACDRLLDPVAPGVA